MDVIVVDGSATAKAAKTATSTIPVIFSLATDPVAEGLVSSMARPGNNLTGLDMSVGYQLAGKRVELLKDVKPNLARLAMLAQPDNTTARAYLQDTEIVSRALGIDTRTFEVRTADDLPRAFAAMVEWRADGVITLADALLFSQRERVVALALNNKLRRRASRGRVSAGRRSPLLWSEPGRSVPAVRFIYRQNSQRHTSRSIADRAAEQARTRRQPQDGTGTWFDDQPGFPAAR